MITKCFNPACQTPFDFRAGRLVRVSRRSTNNNHQQSYQFIEHFWLCGPCAQVYSFECREGMPVELKLSQRAVPTQRLRYLISAA